MENLMIFESFVKSLNLSRIGGEASQRVVEDFEKILADFISMANRNEIFLNVDNDRDSQEFGRKSESPYGNEKIVKILIHKPHIMKIMLSGTDKNFSRFSNTNAIRRELEMKYPNLDIVMGGNLNSRDYELGIGSTIEVRPKKS